MPLDGPGLGAKGETLVIRVQLSTQRGYRMVLGKHISPCFGQRRLCDITKMEIQQFVADKFRQGLAWQTVRNAWIVLSSILDAAVDYSYLNSNPARGVKFPLQSLRKERSIRTIPIGPQTRALLEEHRQRFAIKLREEDLLFPNQLGGPHRESNLLERVLRPAAKAAGLERVTWHQLRHIHASVLHDIGVPAKIAQQQLGHATVETTLNFYTHAIPDTHRRAIESLEQALFPVVPKCSQVGDSHKDAKVVIN